MVDGLQDLGEYDRAQIGVDVLRPGGIFEGSGVCQCEGVLPAGYLPEQRSPGREPSGVRQKQAYRNSCLLRPGECGNVTLHRSVQLDLSFAHPQHQPGGKPDHLGQRSEVVHSAGAGTAGIEVTEAAGAIDEAFAVMDYAQHRTGSGASGYRRVEIMHDRLPIDLQTEHGTGRIVGMTGGTGGKQEDKSDPPSIHGRCRWRPQPRG